MPPLIIAHRGAAHAAPENTLAAFRLGWEEGADGMECDVRLTRDSQVVCIHDADTLRTTGVKLKVAESEWSDLKGLDAGSWKAPKYTGEPPPLLKTALSKLPEGKLILIEVKCGPEIVPHLSELLQGPEAARARIIAFDPEVIRAARQALPQLPAYWITDFRRSLGRHGWKPTLRRILHTLRDIDASGLDCQARRFLGHDWVRCLKAHGYGWHVWTIDDPAMARRFARLGVDSITTNNPGLLRSGMNQNLGNRGPKNK